MPRSCFVCLYYSALPSATALCFCQQLSAYQTLGASQPQISSSWTQKVSADAKFYAKKCFVLWGENNANRAFLGPICPFCPFLSWLDDPEHIWTKLINVMKNHHSLLSWRLKKESRHAPNLINISSIDMWQFPERWTRHNIWPNATNSKHFLYVSLVHFKSISLVFAIP